MQVAFIEHDEKTMNLKGCCVFRQRFLTECNNANLITVLNKKYKHTLDELKHIRFNIGKKTKDTWRNVS